MIGVCGFGMCFDHSLVHRPPLTAFFTAVEKL